MGGGIGHRGPRAGHTHGRAPGCASARRAHAGHTRPHRWQWPSRDTHSHPLNRSCGRDSSPPGPPPHPQLTHSHAVPRLAPLTRRRHAHTTRSAAVGAPPRGTGQRATAAAPRSGREPSRPGGRSPAGTAPWTSQTPSASTQPLDPPLPPCPADFCSCPLPSPHPTHAHGAGVWQVSRLRAERIQVPGVGSQLSGGLQDPLAAPQVITGISIEVPAQTRHTAPEVRGQLHQDPGAWAEGAEGAAYGERREGQLFCGPV